MPKLNADTFTGPVFLLGAALVAMASMIAVVVSSPSSANDKTHVELPGPLIPDTTASSTTAPPNTTPPPIFVNAGVDGATVGVAAVDLAGTTEPGVTLTVNGAAATVDPTGDWKAHVALQPGKNTITVVAKDAVGNSSNEAVTVTYTPPAPTTVKPPTVTTVRPTPTTVARTVPPPRPTPPPTPAPTTAPRATTTTLPPDTIP